MVCFTLRQCTYMVAVADHGSIAEAAQALNMSQPAIAQSLDKLEETYGIKLIVRHQARGSDLTPQGRTFCDWARKLLRQAEQTEQAALAIAADLAGHLRLGCFHTIAPFCLSKLIKDFTSDYPEITIEAQELFQDEIISGVQSQKLDLALTYDMSLPLPERKDRRFLEWDVLAHLKAHILLRADHPLARRHSLSLKELAAEPFVMFDGPASREYFEGLLSGQGISPPIALTSKSMESVRCAVANGLGFSLSVMRPQHNKTYDGGKIKSLPIADDLQGLPVIMIRRKDALPSRLVDKFKIASARFFQSAEKA